MIIKDQIIIYPNPSPGIIYIDFRIALKKKGKLVITTPDGEVIRDMEVGPNNLYLNMKKHGYGIFYFKITINETIYFKKVQIVN